MTANNEFKGCVSQCYRDVTLRIKARWRQSNPWTGLGRPWGFQEGEVPRFQDSRHIKVVRLSTIRTGRLYPPGNIPDIHFCYRLSRPQCQSAAGRIMSVENSNDTIGNGIVARCLNRLRAPGSYVSPRYIPIWTAHNHEARPVRISVHCPRVKPPDSKSEASAMHQHLDTSCSVKGL